jgi:Domain of unknown function (DUF4157)
MRTFVQKPKAAQQTTSAKSMIPGRAHFGQSREVSSILHLQRTIGNQAVQQLLQSNAEELNAGLTGTALPHFGHGFSRIPGGPPTVGAIQTKLAIDTPGDEYEQEADRVAEQVMRMPELQLQRACACGGACSKCRAEQSEHGHERLHTKRVESGTWGQTKVSPIIHELLRSPGQPIDLATRAFMEPRFGHDFSHVRVHTDERAADSARAVNAAAYTAGHHLVFAAGRYSPTTTSGRHLLAHELAHSVQQGFAPNRLPQTVDDPGNAPHRQETSAVPIPDVPGSLVINSTPGVHMARKDDPPKAPKCDTGLALRWGQETTCSRFGAFYGVRESGEGKNWRSWGCYNHWPFSLEVYARNQLGISGAASCKASHLKETATVSLKEKEVEVLCSDNFPGGATQVIELSPKAMQELSDGLENLPSVKVCYSGSKQQGLREWDGRLPRNPEVEDCITKGCPAPEDAPKLKDTGWPKK